MPAPDAAWWPLPVDEYGYQIVEVELPTGTHTVDGPDPADDSYAIYDKPMGYGGNKYTCVGPFELRVALMRLAGLTPPHPDAPGGYDDG